MADTEDGVQLLPKETITMNESDKHISRLGCQNYDNNAFYIQDRDVYHHKFQNHVNQLSQSDNYVFGCNNSMLCDEHDGLVNIGPTVGQVETDIMYNQSDANQFQDGCQYLYTGEQYWIQFTNCQFIDHYNGSSIFLVFIQKVKKRSKAVTQYLDKEKDLGAILGPVRDENKHLVHCSPLLTRPKDNNSKRRVILDLSFPPGQSVNHLVDKHRFDGYEFTLRFPSIDDIVGELKKYGSRALLAKIDVTRAFRNLRVDPGDALNFSISWQGNILIRQPRSGGRTGQLHSSLSLTQLRTSCKPRATRCSHILMTTYWSLPKR